MALSFPDLKVLVRGGGEMASGIVHRLNRCHMRVFITEVAAPTTVRRTVAFAEAVFQGRHTIEGVEAIRVSSPEAAYRVWENGGIPLFIDPEAGARKTIQPEVIVDAIMAKRNIGTDKSHAPV